MPRIFFKFNSQIITLVTAALLMATFAIAQDEGKAQDDPVQWHQENVTPDAHYQTSRQEAGAAYEEQKKACRTQEKNAAQRCIKEAKQQWQTDLKRAEFVHGSTQ